MICEFCGHEIPDNAKFCPNCATLVTPQKLKKPSIAKPTTTVTKSQPQKQQETTVKNTEKVKEPVIAKQTVEKKVSSKNTPKQKKVIFKAGAKSIPVDKRLLAIGCAGLAAIIALIILFVSIFSSSPAKPELNLLKASTPNGNAYFYYDEGIGVKFKHADGIASSMMTADRQNVVVQTKSGTIYTTDSIGQNIFTLYQAKEGISADYKVLGNKVLYHTFTKEVPVNHSYFLYDFANKSNVEILKYTASSEFKGIAVSSSNTFVHSDEHSIIKAEKGKISIMSTNVPGEWKDIGTFNTENTKVSSLNCTNNGNNAIWTVSQTDASGNITYWLNIYYNGKVQSYKTSNAANTMISTIDGDVSIIFASTPKNKVFFIKDTWLRVIDIENATSAYTLSGKPLSNASSVNNEKGFLLTSKGNTGINIYYVDYEKASTTLLISEAAVTYNISQNSLLYTQGEKLMIGTLNTSSRSFSPKNIAKNVDFAYISGDNSKHVYYTVDNEGQKNLKKYDVNTGNIVDVAPNAISIKLSTNGDKVYYIEDITYAAKLSFGSLIEYDSESGQKKVIERNVITLSMTSNLLNGCIIPTSFFYKTIDNGIEKVKYYDGSSFRTIFEELN